MSDKGQEDFIHGRRALKALANFDRFVTRDVGRQWLTDTHSSLLSSSLNLFSYLQFYELTDLKKRNREIFRKQCVFRFEKRRDSHRRSLSSTYSKKLRGSVECSASGMFKREEREGEDSTRVGARPPGTSYRITRTSLSSLTVVRAKLSQVVIVSLRKGSGRHGCRSIALAYGCANFVHFV